MNPKSLEKLCQYKIWENSHLESKLYKYLKGKENIFKWYYQHLIDAFIISLEDGYHDKTNFEKWFISSSLKILKRGIYSPRNLASVESKARQIYQKDIVREVRYDIEDIREAREELLKPKRKKRTKPMAPNWYKYEK